MSLSKIDRYSQVIEILLDQILKKPGHPNQKDELADAISSYLEQLFFTVPIEKFDQKYKQLRSIDCEYIYEIIEIFSNALINTDLKEKVNELAEYTRQLKGSSTNNYKRNLILNGRIHSWIIKLIYECSDNLNILLELKEILLYKLDLFEDYELNGKIELISEELEKYSKWIDLDVALYLNHNYLLKKERVADYYIYILPAIIERSKKEPKDIFNSTYLPITDILCVSESYEWDLSSRLTCDELGILRNYYYLLAFYKEHSGRDFTLLTKQIFLTEDTTMLFKNDSLISDNTDKMSLNTVESDFEILRGCLQKTNLYLSLVSIEKFKFFEVLDKFKVLQELESNQIIRREVFYQNKFASFLIKNNINCFGKYLGRKYTDLAVRYGMKDFIIVEAKMEKTKITEKKLSAYFSQTYNYLGLENCQKGVLLIFTTGSISLNSTRHCFKDKVYIFSIHIGGSPSKIKKTQYIDVGSDGLPVIVNNS